MADAPDSKSGDRNGRAGSSPASGTDKTGVFIVLVEALFSYRALLGAFWGQKCICRAFIVAPLHDQILPNSFSQCNYPVTKMSAGRLGDWWKADWMPSRIFRSFLRSVET